MPAMEIGRFLTLTDVAEVLNISDSQTYALVRSGELKRSRSAAGGNGASNATSWEAYIAKMYDQTREFAKPSTH